MDFNKTQSVSKRLRAAMETNDANQIEEAFDGIAQAAAEDAYAQLKQDMELYNQTHDQAILERRGARDLTTKETAWYNRIADVLRSSNPKQVFTEIIGSDNEDDVMPNSIIEDVFRNLAQDHPLLAKVKAQNVGYLTKWIRNRHTVQAAAWGTITATIEKEITSAFDVVDVKQNKLSCFVILERGMADLGPVWLDTYIRQTMTGAMAVALETAIVSGTGVNMPIGMDRITTSGNTETGYTQKTAVALTSFSPEEYGAFLAGFAYDEDGHRRKFNKVTIICNETTYLTKIMPATTILNANASYVNNVFPFATDVVIYTIKICNNENVFLPQYRSAMTNDIIATAKDIFMYAWSANGIRVTDTNGNIDQKKRAERKDLQERSIRKCNDLLALMQMAQKLFHLKTKRIKYWGGKTIEVRELLKKWKESDTKRYADNQKSNLMEQRTKV